MICRAERERGERRQSLLACALAFCLLTLLVFQGFAAAGSHSGARHPSDEAPIVAALLSATCSIDAGGETPTPVKKLVQAQCCALCGAHALDAPSAPGRSLAANAMAPISPQPSSARYVVRSLARPPIGWASSWSSQAPPSAC